MAALFFRLKMFIDVIVGIVFMGLCYILLFFVYPILSILLIVHPHSNWANPFSILHSIHKSLNHRQALINFHSELHLVCFHHSRLVGKTDTELDIATLDKIVTIQKLPEEDRHCIMYSLDGLIQHAKNRAAYVK